MGKERSAGLLIFRRFNSQIEFLLLKASEMGQNWTPPKGLCCTITLFVLLSYISVFKTENIAKLNIVLNILGHLEPGEDDITAALRETKEEAGYAESDLQIQPQHFKILQYKVRGNDKSVIYWLAELKDPQNRPKLSHEHTEFRWSTKDDAILLVGFDDFAEMINEFHNKIDVAIQ